MALFIVHILPSTEPYSTVGALIAVGGHLVAFTAISLAIIYGVSAFVREPENCDFHDLAVVAGAFVLCGLCVYRVATLGPVY